MRAGGLSWSCLSDSVHSEGWEAKGWSRDVGGACGVTGLSYFSSTWARSLPMGLLGEVGEEGRALLLSPKQTHLHSFLHWVHLRLSLNKGCGTCCRCWVGIQCWAQNGCVLSLEHSWFPGVVLQENTSFD